MINKIKKLSSFIYQGLYLVLIELCNQFLIAKTIPIQLNNIKTAIIFDVIYTLIIFGFIYLLKGKIKRIFILLINVALLLLTITNYFLYSYFINIFSWKDLLLSGEGFAFINSVFKFINLKSIFICVLLISLIVLIYRNMIRDNYCINKLTLSITILAIISLLFGRTIIQKKYLTNTSDGWDSESVLNNGGNYYQEWIDPVRLLRICGTYEYFTRDLKFSFFNKTDYTKLKKDIESYIENKDINQSDKYEGIFENKNLILIMAESLDDWLINEKSTPTIYEMIHHGFNFTNHYSPEYVTGPTANSEFIANTGMYPNINKLSPNYAYVNNSYPYSLASLFKNQNYIVNSYHRSFGWIYNRGIMHSSLGYTKYHNYSDLGISDKNLNLDSYLIKDGYDLIVNKDSKFMSFIITYTPHSPYTYQKEECTTNLDAIKKSFPNETNEEILCAYSAARETDNMLKELKEKLTIDNMLDDTVIIVFADHPNKVVINDSETSLKNKTLFFIYNNKMGSNQIDTITSTVNILPTINNLFSLESEYVYPGYDALNYSNGYVIFKDYTYFDGNNISSITEEMLKDINYSKNVLNANYYK